MIRLSATAAIDQTVNGTATLTYDMYPADWPVAPGEMHFRLVEPQLGTLDLGCANGYIVKDYEFSSPEIRELAYNNSLDDGTYDLTQYIGARAVTLNLVLRNTPGIDGSGVPFKPESQMRDDVLKFCHPGRRPTLLFSEHGDNRCRSIQLRGTEFGWNVSKPRFNSLSLSWKAPRGIIESIGDACVKVSYKESLPSQILLDIENPGNVSSTWTMSTQGQLIDPVFQLGDQKLSLAYDAAPTDIVTIDSYNKSVAINGIPSGYKYLNDYSDWFKIPPGRSTITITHGGVSIIGYEFGEWEPQTALPAPAGTTLWANPPHQAPPGTPPWSWSTEVLNPPARWTTTGAYAVNAIVWYNGMTFKATAPVAAGAAPPGSNPAWVPTVTSDWEFAVITIQLCYKPSWI